MLSNTLGMERPVLKCLRSTLGQRRQLVLVAKIGRNVDTDA